MIEVEVKTTKTIDASKADAVVKDEADRLARALSEEYARELRLALIQFRAVASAGTLKSVRDVEAKASSRESFKRQVVASRSIIFINDGRRAGAKYPARFIGEETVVSKSGKERTRKIFAPVKELLDWLGLMQIPSSAWFLVMRKIARKGIKARGVVSLAVRRSEPRKVRLIRLCAQAIARRVLHG